MKPRRVKIVLLGIGGLLAVLGMVCLARPRPFRPSLSLHVASYTKDSNGNVIATLGVKNTGSSPFTLADWIEGSAPMARVEVNKRGYVSWITYTLSPSRTGQLHVLLPADARSWYCFVSVYRASAREIARNWLGEKKLWTATYPVSYWLTRLAPDGFVEGTNILSPTFQVPAELARP